jgi:hexosaminidase
MNVLHLHLVDDQGWRIEIKSTELTEIGAWRLIKKDKLGMPEQQIV